MNSDILIVEELLKEHEIEYDKDRSSLIAAHNGQLLFKIFTLENYYGWLWQRCARIGIADPDFIDNLKKKIKICIESGSCSHCPYIPF